MINAKTVQKNEMKNKEERTINKNNIKKIKNKKAKPNKS